MNRIDTFFATGRKAFIPYITAGYPSVDETLNVLRLLVNNGADIIELGYPFSDPTADGPVLQVSSFEALQAGFTRDDYFRIVTTFREEFPDTPLVIFSYYNPIFHHGVESFVERAAKAGADAMLVVDLPFEEQHELKPHLEKHGMHFIQLIAPTTPPERAKMMLAGASGFVYQIARRGVTGKSTNLSEEAIGQSSTLKELTSLPVGLGFGVSTGDQAVLVARHNAGVIVGSALVSTITNHLPNYTPHLIALVRELAEATHSENP